jgi:hypothetical protein
MKTYLTLCLAAAVLCAVIAPAAAEETPRDTGASPFSVRLILFTTSIDVGLQNNENGMPDLSFQPDTGSDVDSGTPQPKEYYGIEAHYRHFGISYKLAPRLVDLHNFDSTASYIAGHIAAQAYFRNYSGFRLADRRNMGLTPAEEEKYGIRPDLRVRDMGLNFFYFFSDKFVFYGPLNPSAVQRESGGSWMIKLSPYLVRIESDYPLVPESFRSAAPDNGGFTGGNYWGVNILGGYGYTFIWNDLYITPALCAGGGLQYQDAGSQGGSGTLMPVPDFDFSVAVGYEANGFFFGLWFVNENTFIPLEDFEIQILGFSMELFAGRRF